MAFHFLWVIESQKSEKMEINLRAVLMMRKETEQRAAETSLLLVAIQANGYKLGPWLGRDYRL